MKRLGVLGHFVPGVARLARHFRPLFHRERFLMAGSLGAVFAEVVFRILEPWPLKFVIDDVLGAGTSNGTLSPQWTLALAALALVAFSGLRSLMSYLSTVGFALTGNRVLTEVRNHLYRHLQALSLRYHAKARSGDLIVRLMGDVGMLKEVAVTALLPLIGNVLVMVTMAGVMLWLNWKLALVVSAVLPLLLLTARRKSARIRQVARGQRKREAALATTAAESIVGIHAVQALGLDEAFRKDFTQQGQRSLSDGVKGKRLAAGLERSVDGILAVASALTLWCGAWLVLRGELSLGELIVFLSYLKSSFKPIRNTAKFTGRIAKASAAAERVLEVLEEKLEVQDLPGARPAPPLQGATVFEHISFSYESAVPVLDDVSFAIAPGERVAIVGASGAGKSTIVGLLLRLYDPERGRVLLDGQDIRSWTVASIRSQIAVVLQDTALFATSIGENIAAGTPSLAPEEIERAARLANAHEFIESLPDGYDTQVGERGVTLSAGQRQRIAIARAAIRLNPILVFDEPTTGLDEENEREVSLALERISEGRTTILITHRLSYAARADRILYLEGGAISEQGTHEELVRAGGRYAQLYQSSELMPAHGVWES